MNNLLLSTYNINFNARYTPEQICADLCKGACCNHGTPMGIKLKKIADKFTASYWNLSNDLKTPVLTKPAVLNWLLLDPRPEPGSLNKMANIHLDALSKERDASKRKMLMEQLERINAKLEEIYGDSECFVSITNPKLLADPNSAIYPDKINPCVFKDHNRTNRCSIYHGVKDDNGELIPRPRACIEVGGDAIPCPWLNPEKLQETLVRTRALLAIQGYDNLPDMVIKQHVVEQFNLNETWVKKIYEPFLRGEE